MSRSSLTGAEVATITTVAMTREVVTTIISTATDPQRSSAYKRTTAITSLGMLSGPFEILMILIAFVIFTADHRRQLTREQCSSFFSGSNQFAFCRSARK